MKGVNLSKKDVNVLLIFLGIVIALLSFFFVARRFTGMKEQLEMDNMMLQSRLMELQDYELNLPDYNMSIKEASATITGERKKYKEEVRIEDLIMFAVELENTTGVEIDSVSFQPPVLLTEFDAPNDEGVQTHYYAYSISMTMGTRFGYTPMKDALKKIQTASDRTVLDTLALSYDSSTGGLVGNMVTSKIFITDGSYVYVPTEVPAGLLGTPNPFGTITAPSSLPADEAGEDEGEDAADGEPEPVVTQ